MEFWEGAILIVGGLWLVGRMSRNSTTSPLNKVVASVSAIGTVGPTGNTASTNQAGNTSLIAGEPLTPAGPPITINTLIGSSPVTLAPVVSPYLPRQVGVKPIAAPVKAPQRFTAL